LIADALPIPSEESAIAEASARAIAFMRADGEDNSIMFRQPR
jgi:hypothetical protein